MCFCYKCPLIPDRPCPSRCHLREQDHRLPNSCTYCPQFRHIWSVVVSFLATHTDLSLTNSKTLTYLHLINLYNFLSDYCYLSNSMTFFFFSFFLFFFFSFFLFFFFSF